MKKSSIFIALIAIIIIAVAIALVLKNHNNNERKNSENNIQTIEKINITNYAGKWLLSSIEKDDEVIDGTEYFGSGITYGGVLTLKEDFTYTEYIGIQGENLEKYEGTYRILGNKIYLTSKTGVEQEGIIKGSFLTLTDKVFRTGDEKLILRFEQEDITDMQEKTKVFVGTTDKFESFDVTINTDVAQVEDTAELLIDEIAKIIGYEIKINEVTSVAGGMSVNLKEDSAPFDVKNTYIGNNTEKYHLDDLENIVYTIFDSINETLQQYYGENLKVYFSKDGNDIVIDTITSVFRIVTTEPYDGSSK